MNRNSVKHYLQQPYARIVIPAEEGGFHAEVLEFPGCYAQGESPSEAYSNLEKAAEAWVEACLERGQAIPEPSSSLGFNGNVLLRLPRSVHRQAAKMATRDRTSLNQYLLAAISARVGADDLYNLLSTRLERRLMTTAYSFVKAAFDAASTSETSPAIDARFSLKKLDNRADTCSQSLELTTSLGR